MIKGDEGMPDLHRGTDLHREDRGGEAQDLHRAYPATLPGQDQEPHVVVQWASGPKDPIVVHRAAEADREALRLAEQVAMIKERHRHDWLVDRVEMWARVLGVSHWRLVVAIGAGDTVLEKTSIARLHRTDFYREAAIMFREGAPPDGLYAIPEATPELDKSIVHELLHLAFDEIDREITDALLFVEDRDVRSRLADRMLMRLEQIVEDLAEVIGDLGKQASLSSVDEQRLGSVTAAPSILTHPMFEQGREPNGANDLEDRIPTALPDDEKVKVGMMRDAV